MKSPEMAAEPLLDRMKFGFDYEAVDRTEQSERCCGRPSSTSCGPAARVADNPGHPRIGVLTGSARMSTLLGGTSPV